MPVNPDTQRLENVVQQLLRRVSDLERANPLENATIGRGGITITKGGALTVKDTDGTVVGIIGALPAVYDRVDGTPQPGVAFYREDGSLAALLGDLNATIPPYRQSFQVLDRHGHVIMADDTNGGQGVALPYLTFGTPTSNAIPTDLTTSATFTTLQSAAGYWMSAKVTGQILVYSSDASTTGQVRVTDENGTQVGATITVTANEFAWVNWGPVVIPGNFGDGKVLNVQARRTGGTGTIGINAGTLIGVQS